MARDTTQTPCPLLNINSADDLVVRGRILAAAKQRFARFGCEDTTLEDLARAASLKVKQVHKHFTDVYAVMVALQRTLEHPRAQRGPRPNSGFAAREHRLARARDARPIEA
ncbi:MAG TPA: TetR family transcriptional regulator [Gammaproteobacteria bacterium]|jgi:AcrR family transcriptional regulator